MVALGQDFEDEGPKQHYTQQYIDFGSPDLEENELEYIPSYTEMQARVAQCTECKTVIPDNVVEKNVFYQSGMSMACIYCGGVVAIVPEVLSTTETFKSRLDQIRGLDSTRDINY